MSYLLDNRLAAVDPELSAKLDKQTQRTGPDECWLWKGEFWEDGTPYVRVRTSSGEVRLAAHRVAVALREGRLGELDRVFRSCKSKACMNPAHTLVKRAAEPQRKRDELPGWQSGNGLLWVGEHEREVKVLYALCRCFHRGRPDQKFRN